MDRQTAEAWADEACATILAQLKPSPELPFVQVEVGMAIRAAYVEGYIRSLSDAEPPEDACLRAEILRLLT